jgi:CRISPR/Cas system type I-B associated protein Csh2 (Cas7 group RAMP superfamily)
MFDKPENLTSGAIEDLPDEKKLVIWRDISSKFGNVIGEYSRRKLKYESDIFNAVVGVLNSLSRTSLPIYHC